MKILVTGSSGFVGKNLVPHLKANHFDVLTLDAVSNDLFETNFEYKLGTFSPITMEMIEKSGAQSIIHLAAQSHVDRAISGPRKFVDDNVNGTIELFEVARKMELQNIILFSTDEVGGSVEEGSFFENDPMKPENTYAATKAMQEHLAQSYVKAYDLPIVITRCANIFGKHQADEKFMPTVIRNALADKPIPVYGNGKQIREWVPVEFVCEFIHFLAQASFVPPMSRLHITSSETGIQNLHLVYMVLAILGKPTSLVSFVSDRPGHDVRYSLGRSNATDMYGLPNNERNFMKDLEETINWYRGERYGRIHTDSN